MDTRQPRPETHAYILIELKTLLKEPENADGARQFLR
jgi:hypothetical protein